MSLIASAICNAASINSNQLDYVYKSVSALSGQDCATDTVAGLPVGSLQAGLGLCVLQLQEVRQPTWRESDFELAKRKVKLFYTEASGATVDLVEALNLPSGTLAGASQALGQGSYFALDTAKTDERGECPVVSFTPGLSKSFGEDLEIVAPDFGRFFLDTIRADLE